MKNLSLLTFLAVLGVWISVGCAPSEPKTDEKSVASTSGTDAPTKVEPKASEKTPDPKPPVAAPTEKGTPPKIEPRGDAKKPLDVKKKGEPNERFTKVDTNPVMKPKGDFAMVAGKYTMQLSAGQEKINKELVKKGKKPFAGNLAIAPAGTYTLTFGPVGSEMKTTGNVVVEGKSVTLHPTNVNGKEAKLVNQRRGMKFNVAEGGKLLKIAAVTGSDGVPEKGNPNSGLAFRKL